MVFGFFSRKQAAPAATTAAADTQSMSQVQLVAGSASSTTTTTTTPTKVEVDTPMVKPFVFPKPSAEQQRQLHTPAPSISFSGTPAAAAGSPPPFPPPHTPSPPPADEEISQEPLVTDPRALHALIKSVPPQTLHSYCLDLLEPAAFDTVTGRKQPSPKRRRRKSAIVATEDAAKTASSEPPLKPHPLLTSPTLTALTSFFKALVPPPQLHCVRCHKHYFELENTDWSCRVPHDDDSTIVERVGTKIDMDREENDTDEESGSDEESKEKREQSRARKAAAQAKSSIYETLWGCCGQTVEGDGDQGPPDGWCYEGRHTADPKRARFRADSTPQDDKLISCQKMKCFRPPVSQSSTNTPSVISAPAGRKRKRATRLSIDYREPDDDEPAGGGEGDDDVKSTTSSVKRRRKGSCAVVKGKGKGRAGKRVVKSKEEVDEDDDAYDAMEVDQPIASVAVPRSPPASPQRKPVSSASTTSAATSNAKPKQQRKPRTKPSAVANASASTKPANPSPLGPRQDTVVVQSEDNQAGSSSPFRAKTDEPSSEHQRSRSQVFVEIPSRQGSRSPTRNGGLTRADIIKVKARASVASLRDKFEGKDKEAEEPEKERRGRLLQRHKPLNEVVGSSVDNEVDMG